MVGKLKIEELRAQGPQQLGPFDIAASTTRSCSPARCRSTCCENAW
jgi:hypothetical protein